MAYQPKGVVWDGTNDWANLAAQLNGVTDGTTGYYASWLKLSLLGTSQWIFTAGGSPLRFIFRLFSDNRFDIIARDTGGGTVLQARSDVMSDTTNWFHFMCSWDASNVHLYIDDADAHSSGTPNGNTIDYTTSPWVLGSSTGGGSKFNGWEADKIFGQTYYDLSVAANRRLFVEAGATNSVDLGSDGTATGLTNVRSYHSVRGSDVPNNFADNKAPSGNGYTLTGNLTASASDPPPALDTGVSIVTQANTMFGEGVQYA